MDETETQTRALPEFNGVAPHISVMEITPQLAEQWLANNTHNRHLSMRQVKRLADAMKRGEWILNGEPVQFSADGRVLNGQHRLHAVVESGVTIQSVVIRGLAPIAQETIDIGAKRSLASMFKLRGEVNTHVLVSAMILVKNYREQFDGERGATPHQLFAMLDAEPHFRESVKMGEKIRSRTHGLLRPSVATASFHILSEIDPDDAEDFFEKFSTGLGLVEQDAIYALRRQLERLRQQSGLPPANRELALVIKAWNAYRNGEPVGQLVWRAGGRSPERYPVAT